MCQKGKMVYVWVCCCEQAGIKIKDFDTYQSFYCGLCQQLKQRFGQFSRLALNYDMTFLAILLSGLYEPKTKERKIRCILHPAHKKMF